jgi:GT2 family glycosyltransferase
MLGRMSGAPAVSVVVPTRDRHASLHRTLAALRAQDLEAPWELIVVDDGSEPPLEDLEGARVVRTPGAGPARARNAGVAASRAPVVAFTDDDTEPAPGWLAAAAAFLARSPRHVGVEGPVETPPYDPLFAHSLANAAPGAYWTCNVAFRREVVERLGGFDERFPYPHCEDLDLAFRALELGPIGFDEGMRIVHHPRALTLRQLIGRGRLAASEEVLFARHRERYGRLRRLPARLFPLASSVAYLRILLAQARRDPLRRAPRAAAIAAGYLALVLASTLRRTHSRFT